MTASPARPCWNHLTGAQAGWRVMLANVVPPRQGAFQCCEHAGVPALPICTEMLEPYISGPSGPPNRSARRATWSARRARQHRLPQPRRRRAARGAVRPSIPSTARSSASPPTRLLRPAATPDWPSSYAGRTVPRIIEEAAQAGVKAAVVLTAGFAERGEGLALQRGDRSAQRAGVRVLGPNCLGVMRTDMGLNASFARTAGAPGPLALVSQSGAICGAILDWAHERASASRASCRSAARPTSTSARSSTSWWPTRGPRRSCFTSKASAARAATCRRCAPRRA